MKDGKADSFNPQASLDPEGEVNGSFAVMRYFFCNSGVHKRSNVPAENNASRRNFSTS